MTGKTRPAGTPAPEAFIDATIDAQYTKRRRVNGRGWSITAFESDNWGDPYRGVAIVGPDGRGGYYPNLLGVGTEGLPLYVVKAAERLALEEFSPSTQLPEEVTA